jgi:mitogen-activated protein kinase 1/3
MSSESKDAKTKATEDKKTAVWKPCAYHAFMVNGVRFVIDNRYTPIRPLGTGAYGCVCAAKDKKLNRSVAIKRVQGAFDDQVDAKRIIREIKILSFMNHECVIKIYDIVPPCPNKPFDDIYLVQELMETDLYSIIYSRNALTPEHVQFFMYQIVVGVHYLHSANIIHRDLKPGNLLVNGNCELKVCDFGLARGVEPAAQFLDITEYVVTRWYRAPEIMVSDEDYDLKVDIWAIGCIFAELLMRKPLFPGDNYIKQLSLILGVNGTPNEEDTREVFTAPAALEFLRSEPVRPKVPLKRLMPSASDSAIDLMEHMLDFNPRKRWTIEQCMNHPYFDSLRGCKPEGKCETPFPFEFRESSYSKGQFQDMVWKEIEGYRPGSRPPPGVVPAKTKNSDKKSRA